MARREDRLRALEHELVERHGVAVDVAILDLTADGAPEELRRRTEHAGRTVDVLVNNAGYGLFGEFSKLDWEREHNMLELDVIVPVHLTKLFLPGMLERGFGHVLNVASIGAYQPSPLYASYSAAKSFVLNFTEALSYELRGTGVHATALSPGVVATEFLHVAGQTPTRYRGAAGWTARRSPASASTPCSRAGRAWSSAGATRPPPGPSACCHAAPRRPSPTARCARRARG